MQQLSCIALAVLALVGIVALVDLNDRAEAKAPSSPYAACDAKPTAAERSHCRSLVSFAMSAGL